jgi:hypothetical protein
MISCCASRGDGAAWRMLSWVGECGSPGLDAIAALARGALRTLLGVSTVHASSEDCNDPPQEVGLLAKSN